MYHVVPNVKIKDCNVLIDQKLLSEIPIKNEEETYEAIIEVIKNNYFTTGNLLDYEYFSKDYKLIVTDVSKQTELKNSELKQQINSIGSLEQNTKIFFIIEKEEETVVNFHKILWIFLSMYKNGSTKD